MTKFSIKFAALALTISLLGCSSGLPPAPQALPSAAPAPEDRALYFAQEASYAAAALGDTTRLKWHILDRIKDLQIAQPQLPEIQIGQNYYALTLGKGERLESLTRRNPKDGAGAQVIFNPNDFFPRGSICNLGLSPDEQVLAFSVDLTGSSRCDLFVLNFSDSETISLLQRDIGQFDWAPDSKTIYFSTNINGRPANVLQCAAAACTPQLMLHEERSAYYLNLHTSRDRQLLLVTSTSAQAAELFSLEFARRERGITKILTAPQGDLRADHFKDRFFVLLRDAQGQQRLAYRSDDCSAGCRFQPVTARSLESTDFALFDQAMLTFYRTGLQSRLELSSYEGVPLKEITAAGAWSRLRPGINPSPTARSAYYVHESPEQPNEILELNLESFKVTNLNGHHKLPLLKSTVEWVHSADGTKVPLTLVTKPGMAFNTGRPVLVQVYGAYGHELDPTFRPEYVALTARGVDLAFCHVRGGGEMGPSWHSTANGWHKTRSIDDFKACLEFLNQRSPGSVAGYGRSAGGLLVAALLQSNPRLLAAAVLEAPFVDLLSALARVDAPHAAREYAEWGDPQEPGSANYLNQYSPAATLRPGELPPTLIILPTNDEIIDPLDTLRWARRARTLQAAANPIVILPQWGATHARAADETQRLQVLAQSYAFILKAFGLN